MGIMGRRRMAEAKKKATAEVKQPEAKKPEPKKIDPKKPAQAKEK